MERVHIWVSGKVQGVWYRATTVEEAKKLGLTGCVRNLPDGRVEIVAEGPRESLERLIAWCHEGPPLAVVDEVKVVWEPYTGEFAN
ncbi:MAG: acylphosphatase, partial [Aquificota bacterium]